MAILGFVFVIPALILVSDAGLASPQFKGVLNTVIHPVTVLGGALLAFGFNLIPCDSNKASISRGASYHYGHCKEEALESGFDGP